MKPIYEPKGAAKEYGDYALNIVKIEYQGEERTIAEWADRFGLNYPRFYQALKRGWTIGNYLKKETHNRGNLHT